MGNCKLDTNRFQIQGNHTHNGFYDYSLVNYINNKTKVKIICPEHGVFEQRPDCHIFKKSGCPKCGKNERVGLESFILRSNNKHFNKYNYSLVEYKNNGNKVKIICPEHGVFEQRPDSHMNRGQGCPKCVGRYKTTEEFIRDAKKKHGDLYGYEKTFYKNKKTNIDILCPNHGIFNQNPSDHLSGCGCPICKLSKGEKEVKNWLEGKCIEYIQQHKFDDCRYKKPLLFDFYLPKNNICIEYNGRQHYEENEFFGGKLGFLEYIKRDMIKQKYCEKNGIKLFTIRYDDDIENRLTSYLL